MRHVPDQDVTTVPKRASSFSLFVESPSCFHGTMLSIVNAKTKAIRYTCSAFRRKTDCEVDACCSGEDKWPIQLLRKAKPELRGYCATCDSLFLCSSHSQELHHDHCTRIGITDQLLKMPSFLLSPISDTNTHYQYLFSLDTLNNLYAILHQIGVQYVICVGTPRLHEFIQLERFLNQQTMDSFLLDLDFRLGHFYSPGSFARFNMVNGYFFREMDRQRFEAFTRLMPDTSRYLLICDPPFNAPLVFVVQQMYSLSRRYFPHLSSWGVKCSGNGFNRPPMFFILPYFFIKKLQNIDEAFSLLDYKITYANHSRFDWDGNTSDDRPETGKGRRRDSVIRLFTNIAPALVPPPKNLETQFWFCRQCERYSSNGNRHCDQCGMCPTKHGPTYVHCAQCKRCRPPNRIHCLNCTRCVIPNQCPHQTRSICTPTHKAKRTRKQ